MEHAIVMLTTPIVADVPNAVPVRNDMSERSRKSERGAVAGVRSGVTMTTIWETVPQARHSAVRAPMRMNDWITPLAEQTPSAHMRASSRAPWPR